MLIMGKALKANGHSVYFGGRRNTYFLSEAEKINPDILSLNISFDFDPRVMHQLRDFYRDHSIDIVVAEHNKDIRAAGLAAKMGSKCKIIARTGLPSIKNNFRYRLIFPAILDAIIVTTESIKEVYRNYSWLSKIPIYVSPNGIQPVEIPDEKITLDDVSSDRPIIGIFGKLTKKKQHDIFIEVAARLLQEFKEVNFLIVGEGPERRKIQKYANELGIIDHLYMVGYQKELLPYYLNTDILLLTSQEEGLPQVVLEGMMMQRPVVAFDVGSIAGLIEHNRDGCLVPPNDIYRMTEEVKNLLSSPALRQKLGAAARQKVLSGYNLNLLSQSIENILSEIKYE